ncbi:calcium-dependent phosphotriesterase [Myriangium duriaei CBS 260.36]|uniref:Calcium-dependent phosphotriesterase n=1 Tax=Myriangium duriaei CBS 260.36 TaxID=1168546 RepID=A0A9P4J8E5_9PEZI|nr:calcium-dependent phosphotriesterase [Myriangium duriaei CBS 260.36]
MHHVYSFALLIIAIISPQLYQQGHLFWAFRKNAPSTLERRHMPYQFEVKLADKVKNCEDHVLDEQSGWAILSCDFSRDKWNAVMGFYRNHDTTEGGIFLYDYARRHSIDGKLVHVQLMDYPLAGTDFHPLGIHYHAPSQRLLVANNAKAGNRIEVFKLYMDEGVATHIKTIRDVHLPAPNSIHALNEHEFYVTNDHYFTHRQNTMLNHIETLLAIPIAGIHHVDISREEVQVKAVARHPFANGIAQLNDTTWAVSSTSSATVRFYHVDPKSKKWTKKESISLPFFPDNLSVDQEGTLFIAGHPHLLSLKKVVKSRVECNSPEERDTEKCRKMSAPSHVVSWTRDGGVQDIYVDDEFWASTTASRDSEAKMGLVSGLYGDGILVWHE